MEIVNNLSNAYNRSYELACEKLRRQDPLETADFCGAVCDGNLISIKHLGTFYSVNCATGEVLYKTDPTLAVPVSTKVLLTHYLTNACDVALSGRLISFKELPCGGAIYDSNFDKRSVRPLVKRFGEDTQALFAAAMSIGGQRASFGHASVKIYLFPRVPATYVIWQGDEDIPPSGTILFDASIVSYLPVEDIAVVASSGTYELIKRANK